MVELMDKMVEAAGAEPSEEGHECLEKSEEEGDGEEYLHIDSAEDDATGDRHREAVHSEADGQQIDFEIAHRCLFGLEREFVCNIVHDAEVALLSLAETGNIVGLGIFVFLQAKASAIAHGESHIDAFVEVCFECCDQLCPSGIGLYTFVGDGSFIMLHSELYTAIQEGIKINIMAFDNSGWGCIENLQNNQGTDTFGTV